MLRGVASFTDVVKYEHGPSDDSSDSIRTIRSRHYYYNDGLDFRVSIDAKGPWYDVLDWEDDVDHVATSIVLGCEFPVPQVDSWLSFGAEYAVPGVHAYSAEEWSSAWIQTLSRLQFDDLSSPDSDGGSSTMMVTSLTSLHSTRRRKHGVSTHLTTRG